MIFKYFETIGSSNQWGFWNGCKAQIVILAVLEKCKSVLAESGKFGTLSTDYRGTVIDSIAHDLKIVKLHACVFLIGIAEPSKS